MKFKFLLVGLLFVFSSVGSYAGGDRLGFSLDSIELTKNTWGSGKANLKVLLIYENGSGETSELKVVENKKASLYETISLGSNAGLYIPLNGNSVTVSVMILNVNEDLHLAKLIIQAVGNLSKRKSAKYISNLSKRAWYTRIAKIIVVDMGVDFATDKIIAYLKENEITRTTFSIRKGRNNWHHQGTKKGDKNNIKMSYETRFSGKNATSSNFSSSSNSTTKWITPSSKVCKNNGGKMDSDGCKAEWSRAKNICNASGGSLPSIDELKSVVTDCGGIIDDFLNNRGNNAYQPCYKRKGFASRHYWSSTTVLDNGNLAWGVHIDDGIDGWSDKDYSSYVRCVRAGQ